MPELPELTVYAENLRPRIVEKSIMGTDIRHSGALLQIAPEDFANRVNGRIIKDVTRRGKTLGFLLDSGDRIDVHLMLSGKMYYGESKTPEPCVIFKFHDGGSLVFSDSQYKFNPPREPKLWIGINQKEELGLEPLDPVFTPEALVGICQKRPKLRIKALLTDQKLIGGLGNAYVDEILWAAKVKHDRAASTITPQEMEEIHRAIGETLNLAVKKTRDGLTGEIRGEIRDYFKAHGKRGKPCPRCGDLIAQDYFQKRITNWCPTCQQ
jgi:formamidopyrimidine-DNA glycosylase